MQEIIKPGQCRILQQIFRLAQCGMKLKTQAQIRCAVGGRGHEDQCLHPRGIPRPQVLDNPMVTSLIHMVKILTLTVCPQVS